MAFPSPRQAARTRRPFLGFATKVAARKHVREILRRYDHGQDLQGQDYDFIRALIDLHPDREIILDGGIQRIFVQHPDRFSWQRIKGTRRFCVEHLDDSWYDWSWRDAFEPRSKLQKLSRVFRRIVYPDNEAFRKSHFRGVCEAC